MLEIIFPNMTFLQRDMSIKKNLQQHWKRTQDQLIDQIGLTLFSNNWILRKLEKLVLMIYVITLKNLLIVCDDIQLFLKKYCYLLMVLNL